MYQSMWYLLSIIIKFNFFYKQKHVHSRNRGLDTIVLTHSSDFCVFCGDYLLFRMLCCAAHTKECMIYFQITYIILIYIFIDVTRQGLDPLLRGLCSRCFATFTKTPEVFLYQHFHTMYTQCILTLI